MSHPVHHFLMRMPFCSNSNTIRSIKASSSVIADNRGEDGQQQREPEYHRGKEEFVPSQQMGHWSDEHDFKRLLTENDNVFYPIRSPPQPASIKSTSFIGSTMSDSSGGFDKSNKFFNDLPKFHSSSVVAPGVNHVSSSLPVSEHVQNYPRFNDFVVQSQSNNGGGGGGPIDIPHYVQREVEKPFRFPGHNHRTTQFDPPTTQWNVGNEEHRSDVRVQPLLNANPASGTPKHSSHRSTNFIHSQPDHPYTFDFGHDESAASSSFSKQEKNHGKPALEFYDLNEYEKFPTTEHQLHHLPPPSNHYHRHHHLQHGGLRQHG